MSLKIISKLAVFQYLILGYIIPLDFFLKYSFVSGSTL
jgi:hypothetical protein